MKPSLKDIIAEGDLDDDDEVENASKGQNTINKAKEVKSGCTPAQFAELFQQS